MRILAPTDFSKSSRVAVLYAAHLAKKLNAELQVVHVVFIQASSRVMLTSKFLEEEMQLIALKDMENLVADIKKNVKGKFSLSTKVLLGFPVTDMLNQYMKKVKVDYVVTSTQGATGLKKALVGTNTAALMAESAAPVILIPRNTTYKPIKRVVYATDLSHMDQELRSVLDFLKPFNAAIEVIHILPEDGESSIDVKEISKDLIDKMEYPKIKFSMAHNNDVAGALDNFMIDKKADLLIMFTHKPGIVEKLFSRSITQKLAFHSHLPMLTFNRSLKET